MNLSLFNEKQYFIKNKFVKVQTYDRHCWDQHTS